MPDGETVGKVIHLDMNEYQVKSKTSLSFEVTKDDKLIGKLLYKSWFKFNAVIEMANHST